MKKNVENFKSKAYYGLPEDVLYCSLCSNSNQKPSSEKEYKHNINTKKPTIAFDENGICSACKVSESKKTIDWGLRESQLKELCDKYRRSDGRYDCLVPGSGGKDSFYAAHKLKYEYGMNPLTVTWAPHIYTDWGWKNFQSWIHSGFDNYLFTPNGKVHRLLTRLALENLFHPFQPFMMGQMYFPPKMAANLDIPLVFYGENPAEYGNKKEANLTASKELSYFSSNNNDDFFIAGKSASELKNSYGLTSVDLEPYMPANKDLIESKKINVQYLGYYMPWHPQECFYYAAENGGFSAAPERSSGTYSKYSSIDDKVDDFHYYTTFIKFGIGRATYDSCQEIRNGEISREEAIALIKKYDGEYPKRFEKEIFTYLSITQKEFPTAYKNFDSPILDYKYFEALTNKFRSPHIWKNENNTWSLRKAIYDL
tara:strand:- start:730 stop:2007 length:1278 start_codon:yes stop_codon:yes gene_type:complete